MNCLPFIIALIVYIGSIIIHVITLSSYKRYKTLCHKRKDVNGHISGIVMSLIIIILTYILCIKNKENWAWFVVILPFIIGLITFLILVNRISNLKNEINDNK